MNPKKDKKIIPVIVLVTYLLMITINSLANIIPINGRGTGDVSDAYTNLFAPAALTFAIWGLIYLLLFAYSIYQISNRTKMNLSLKTVLDRIGVVFAISSIANVVWIFAWHYDIIWLSLIMMLCILICLIYINLILRNQSLSRNNVYLIKLPFSIYFGWITVATIANITTFLVSIGWNLFGINELIWTSIIIIIGCLIGILAMNHFSSISYGAVIIWAYCGILIKHVSESGFNGQYSSIIIVVTISLVLLVLSEIFLVLKRLKNND